MQFVATGGYALGNYERFRRLTCLEDGSYQLASPHLARQYRMNMGTIVQSATCKVRLNRGPVLGEIEEYFVQGLVPGDTFMFAGKLLKFLGIHQTTMSCVRPVARAIPRYRPMPAGGCP